MTLAYWYDLENSSRTIEPEEEVKWLSSLQWFIWNSQYQLFTNLNEIITASSSFTVLIAQWDKLIRLKKDWRCWLSEWIWLYTHTLKGFYGEKKIIVNWMAKLHGIFERLCTLSGKPRTRRRVTFGGEGRNFIIYLFFPSISSYSH